MKLQQLEITNVLGIRQVNIRPKHGAILIAGANGAGKSSIAECVRLAVLQQQPRGSGLKKDYPDLLHHGSKAGSVAVTFDQGAFTAALPSGKGSSTMGVSEAMNITLNPGAFSAATPAERRTMLFKLMGVKVTASVVKEKLEKRGVDSKRAEMVTPLLAAGFESAMTEAKAKARDSKAAWRAITGETYGSEKGKDWKADVPAAPNQEVFNAQAEFCAELEDMNDKLSRELGGMQAQQNAAKRRDADMATLRDHAAKLPDIESLLAKNRAELQELAEKVSKAEVMASGKKTGADCTCPDCGALLTFDSGKLEQRQEADHTDAHQAIAALPKYRKARDLMQRAVANGERDLLNANAAKINLEKLEGEEEVPPSAEEVQEVIQQAEKLAEQRKDANGKLNAMRQAFDQAQAAAGTTAKAAEHHADVAAWDLIAEAMAPNGIQSELLQDALNPFNAKLKEFGEMSTWPEPFIDSEMVIWRKTAIPDSYAFISESEQWRCDAIIGSAFAYFSKTSFFMLDRMDVLQADARTEVIYWLSDLAAKGINSLTFGTMKSVPAGLDELGIHGVWIEGGVIAEGRM